MNFAYINIFRAKLGLPPVSPPEDARGRHFSRAIEETLHADGWRTRSFQNEYAKLCRDDIHFAYYRGERAAMREVGMEKVPELESRMVAQE